MRRWLVLGLVVAAAVGTAASAPVGGAQGTPPIPVGGAQGTPPINEARQSGRLSARDAIAHYARGDFSVAVRDLDTQALKVALFTRALDEWIANGDADGRQHRRKVATAFALDATWVATRTTGTRYLLSVEIPSIDPERVLLSESSSQGLVAQWAVQQLPVTGVPDSLERMLWLSAIGLTEDIGGWHRLDDEILPRARKRLPDEPRVRLAEVLARTNRDLRSFRRPLSKDRDILRKEPLGSSATGPIPGAIRAFEPLLADPALTGEIELRIGYLELRRDRWSAALTRFDAARSKATDPTLRATADYFAGWISEQLDRADDAIAAYRRALAIAPTMRNLATRLSALLYLRNERAEAYALLDTALNTRPAPVDLMVQMERGDARLVPDWLASIRQALR